MQIYLKKNNIKWGSVKFWVKYHLVKSSQIIIICRAPCIAYWDSAYYSNLTWFDPMIFDQKLYRAHNKLFENNFIKFYRNLLFFQQKQQSPQRRQAELCSPKCIPSILLASRYGSIFKVCSQNRFCGKLCFCWVLRFVRHLLGSSKLMELSRT